jgi:hypothetical protein
MHHRIRLFAYGVSIVLVLAASSARATYTLTPLCNGSSAAQVTPGASFLIDLNLTSDAGDMCDSVIFDVSLSSPGLVLNEYVWGGAYYESGFDNSTPQHFENFTLSDPAFGTGRLLTLSMTVPSDYAPTSDLISVHVEPGTFALGTTTFTPIAGSDLKLTVVPEPATFFMAALSSLLFGAFSLRQRRK